jgi:hypothetical protein
MRDVQINRAINFVSADYAGRLKLIEPSVDQRWRVIVVGVKKAREHSRGRASPPLIVNDSPKLNE